ncbi:hypothetical protein HPB47_018068 [Ixodes persulcatus]|uniref:Uncharacterized protein n=1 Tax=Ixodes persulcatus TaxID=34615 RepID=A0AC60QPA9_IXOPE|nr:hypothetical protein HPB47_018068 [Ixodes persulcatus]
MHEKKKTITDCISLLPLPLFFCCSGLSRSLCLCFALVLRSCGFRRAKGGLGHACSASSCTSYGQDYGRGAPRLAGLPKLKEKVDSMERSVQFLSKQFDDFEKTIKVHDTEIKELKMRVTDLEKKDELSRAANDQLQKEVNDLEFRSRRLNLEVHGIPEVQGENLIETLNKAADKLEGISSGSQRSGERKRIRFRVVRVLLKTSPLEFTLNPNFPARLPFILVNSSIFTGRVLEQVTMALLASQLVFLLVCLAWAGCVIDPQHVKFRGRSRISCGPGLFV